MNESFTGIESPKYFKQTHTYFNPRNDEDEDLSILKRIIEVHMFTLKEDEEIRKR